MHDELTQDYQTQKIAAGSAPRADREPYVHRALSDLEAELERLIKIAGTLKERLAPVLSPERPMEDLASRVEEAHPQVPVADRVDLLTVRIRALAASLDDAVDRLEV